MLGVVADPQWCEREVLECEGEVHVMLEPGNHLQCMVRFDGGKSETWKVALYDNDTGQCVAFDDGVIEYELENGGNVDACYPAHQHDAIVVLTGSDGAQVDVPLTLEEEESAMCLFGAPDPNVAPAPEPVQTNDERKPDELLIVVEGSPTAKADEGQLLETTVANLAKFLVEQRTNFPGALQDLKSIVERLREFGADSFYVKKYFTKADPAGKAYLIFRGNPRRPGKFFGRRELIRSFGKYSFENPTITQLGFGAKNALKAGAKATVISFVIVAGIDVYQEILEDEVCLSRLGVSLGSDVVKLVASMFAGVGVTAGAAALTTVAGVTVPVVAVAGATLIVCLAVGLGLDWVDNRLGVTEWLRARAVEFETSVRESMRATWKQFFWEMEVCMRYPYTCFGY